MYVSWIRDHIIAAEGNGKKNYDGKPISPEMEQFIEARGCQVADAQEKNCKKLTLDDAMQYQTQALATIICEGDAIGAVALCNGADKDSARGTAGKTGTSCGHCSWRNRWNSKTFSV